MKLKFAIWGLFLLMFACSSEDPMLDRTLDNFKRNIKNETSQQQIEKLFGQPDSDIGSGIHVYVYKLVDETQIWIGYADHIIYVDHIDKDGKTITRIL